MIAFVNPDPSHRRRSPAAASQAAAAAPRRPYPRPSRSKRYRSLDDIFTPQINGRLIQADRTAAGMRFTITDNLGNADLAAMMSDAGELRELSVLSREAAQLLKASAGARVSAAARSGAHGDASRPG